MNITQLISYALGCSRLQIVITSLHSHSFVVARHIQWTFQVCTVVFEGAEWLAIVSLQKGKI